MLHRRTVVCVKRLLACTVLLPAPLCDHEDGIQEA